VPYHQSSDLDTSVARHSGDADLVIFGLTDRQIESDLTVALTRYTTLNDVLFVNASERIPIL
jgi:hypothetical protein